jgi:hypothetical protein
MSAMKSVKCPAIPQKSRTIPTKSQSVPQKSCGAPQLCRGAPKNLRQTPQNLKVLLGSPHNQLKIKPARRSNRNPCGR